MVDLIASTFSDHGTFKLNIIIPDVVTSGNYANMHVPVLKTHTFYLMYNSYSN